MPDPASTRSSPGWTNHRNDFALVAPVNPEVFSIHCDDAVLRIYLAHPNKTEIGEIRVSVLVSLRERSKLRQVIVTIERESKELFSNHLQHKTNVA